MQNQTVTLRPARDTDRAFLLQLFTHTRPELTALPLPEPALQQMIDMQLRAQTQSWEDRFPGNWHRIILSNDLEVGQLRTWIGPDEVRLIDISILPEHRGQGIGRRLISELQATAAQRDLALRLSVQKGNTGAGALYLRLGFRPVAESDMYDELEWRPDASQPKTIS